jgi:undecaprenyl-diphosphatase
MRRAEGALPLRHALILGAVQGPTELLPVSSSAHTALIPWLGAWPYTRLDGELRKSFEVALHVGAGCALAYTMRGQLRRQAAAMDRPAAAVLALSTLPTAIAGAALEGPVERRLGGPRSTAVALAVGALAMELADARTAGVGRPRDDARAPDGLALGLAQAIALAPGVSRNGATLTAARARGFGRRAANELSWSAALPVMLGAGALKGRRLLRTAPPAGVRTGMAAGGLAAFASTLACARLLRGRDFQERPLLPYALYRGLLAVLVARRLRRAQ